MDALDKIQKSDEFNQIMNFDQQKENSKSQLAREKNQLAKDKLQAQIAMKNMDMEIARENKNQYDLKKAAQQKEKSKKKK